MVSEGFYRCIETPSKKYLRYLDYSLVAKQAKQIIQSDSSRESVTNQSLCI